MMIKGIYIGHVGVRFMLHLRSVLLIIPFRMILEDAQSGATQSVCRLTGFKRCAEYAHILSLT